MPILLSVAIKMDLKKNICKNLSVKISKSEFNRLALKYGAIDITNKCDLQISRDDFVQIGRNKYEFTITVTRLDFARNSKGKNILDKHRGDQSNEQTNEQTTTQMQTTNHTNDMNNRYNFRERKRAAEVTLNPPAKRARTLAIVPLRMEKVPNLVPASKNILNEGLVVVAKLNKWPAWPAVIESLQKTNVKVRFFGEDSIGCIPYGNIGLFEENDQLIICNLRRKLRGFEKAVRLAEISMKIPDKFSIVNMV